MNLRVKRIFPVLALCFLALYSTSSCSQKNYETVITIVHTNDTHSQIDPFVRDGKQMGGMVERAAILEVMRDSFPELLYFDSGDMVQGSPYFNLWKGAVEAKGMNEMDLVASTFGNHEFDNGLAYLDTMLTIAHFPMLSCNYNCEGTPIDRHVRKSIIIERQGVRIGVTGITCSPYNLISNRNWKGITYGDPVESANQEAENLKNLGCDIVILLSHEGYDKSDRYGDRKIAAQTRNIDIILGGHSHTNLEEGVIVNNLDGQPVYITQTGGKHYPMGRVGITMKRDGKRNDGTKAFVLSDVRIGKIHPEDMDLRGHGEEMGKMLEPYRADLGETMLQVLGKCDCDLTKGRPESPLGNFTTDALREICGRIYGKPMDVGIMNVGGLRNEIAKGDITLGDLYKVFPFENALVILEMSGELIEQVVHVAERKKLEAFSGITCTLIKDSEGKIRATDIKIGGQPIEKERIYYVATIDYLAEGNDNLTPFQHASKMTPTGLTIRDAMIDYIKELTSEGKVISAKVEGRITEKY